MNKFIIYLFIFFYLFILGCGKEKGKEKVTLSTGEKIVRHRIGESNKDIKKIEELMTQEIIGKIEIVSAFSHPELLDPRTREANEVVSLVKENGERIFLMGKEALKLKDKKYNDKEVKIVATLLRMPAKWLGNDYPAYEVKEIKEIKE